MLLPNEGPAANHHNKERRDRKPTHEWTSHFGPAHALEHVLGEARRRLPVPQGLTKITFELAHRPSPSDTALPFPGSLLCRVEDDSTPFAPASAASCRFPQRPYLHRSEESEPPGVSPATTQSAFSILPEARGPFPDPRPGFPAGARPALPDENSTAAVYQCSDGLCSAEAMRHNAILSRPSDSSDTAAKTLPAPPPPRSRHYGKSYRQCCKPSPGARELRIRNRPSSSALIS